jgi:hypothetical protein
MVYLMFDFDEIMKIKIRKAKDIIDFSKYKLIINMDQ